MNRNILIGAVALVIVGLLLGYWLMSGQSAPSPQSTSTPTPPPSVNATANSSPNPTSAPLPPPASPTSAELPPDHKAEVEREKKVWDLWLATPIAFYGKVVDTDGNPVVGATASISLVDTAGPGEGHTKLQKTSDGQGLFSVSGHERYLFNTLIWGAVLLGVALLIIRFWSRKTNSRTRK